MPRKRPAASTIAASIAVIVVALALFQMNRRRLQANDTARGTLAQKANGAVQTPSAPACTAAATNPDSGHAAPRASEPASIALRMDYAGAEALVNALERDSLTDADVDSLLRIRGLCAMVDNVPRYFPGHDVSEFRTDIREFVRTKKGGEYDRYFQLGDVWQGRAEVRALIAQIAANERTIVGEMATQLQRYRPDTGRVAITSYFVAGGVSDGFAFESDARSLFANLVRANGDLNDVALNMTHEAYHILQFRAQERAGIVPLSAAADTTPPIARLFATTLSEGTAAYVADPTRTAAAGRNIEITRQRYRRNAQPGQIAKNFALFDEVLSDLRGNRLPWEKAYATGFTNQNDNAFYFVGYEMAAAIERYCGRECIGRLFAEPPVEFFRRYVALYRAHPEVTGRFSPATETTIASYGK